MAQDQDQPTAPVLWRRRAGAPPSQHAVLVRHDGSTGRGAAPGPARAQRQAEYRSRVPGAFPPSFRLFVALALVGLAAHAVAQPRAAVAQVGGQAPGYYRLFVGHFEVTALLDGTHPFPSDRVAVGATPDAVAKLLGHDFLASPFEGMINAYLINLDGRLVLVDTGAGDLYGKQGGGLVRAIRAAGYAPEQVADIFITHLHEDHAGGLVLGGRPVFANATVHVSRRDTDFWLNHRNQARVDVLLKPFFPALQKVLEPYRAAGRLKPFDDGATLLPGLTAIAAPGHTPGHTCYLLRDGVEALLFWGGLTARESTLD